MGYKEVNTLVDEIRQVFLAKIKENRDEYEGVPFDTKRIAKELAIERQIAIMKTPREPYASRTITGGYRRPVEYHVNTPSGLKPIVRFCTYPDMMRALDKLRGTGLVAREKVERIWQYMFYEKPGCAHEVQKRIYKKEDELASQRKALKEASKLLERAGIENVIVEESYGELSLSIDDTQGRDFLAFLRRGLGR